MCPFVVPLLYLLFVTLCVCLLFLYSCFFCLLCIRFNSRVCVSVRSFVASLRHTSTTTNRNEHCHLAPAHATFEQPHVDQPGSDNEIVLHCGSVCINWKWKQVFFFVLCFLFVVCFCFFYFLCFVFVLFVFCFCFVFVFVCVCCCQSDALCVLVPYLLRPLCFFIRFRLFAAFVVSLM